MLKKLLIILFVLVLIISCSNNKNEKEFEYTIGINQIISHPALDLAKKGFIDIFNEKGINVKFIENNSNGDISVADLISKNLVLQKVDLIYAIATPTAQVAQNATTEIPIVFSAVSDHISAKLVNKNITGVLDAVDLEEQLKLALEIDPNIKKIGFVYNSSESNSIDQLDKLKKIAKLYSVEIIEKSITQISDLPQVLKFILESTDAIYTPADNLIASSIKLIADTAKDYMKISIGAEKAHVDAGILASSAINYYDLGREAGQIAIDILVNGKKIEEIDVKIIDKDKYEKVINYETKKILGLEF